MFAGPMKYVLFPYQLFVILTRSWEFAKMKPCFLYTYLGFFFHSVTVVFAVAIPNLELFISLIGAFCLSTMGLSFPAMIQLLTFWDYYRGFGKALFILKNLIIIVIAALGFTIGVTTSLQEIYHKFFAPAEHP